MNTPQNKYYKQIPYNTSIEENDFLNELCFLFFIQFVNFDLAFFSVTSQLILDINISGNCNNE